MRKSAAFLRELGRRFIADDCFKLAASLAYTTLLALVPLVTIGLAVFSAFPAFKEFTVGVNEFVARAMLPSTVEQIVATHLDQFTRSAGRLTALGVVVLGLTAILLMQTIDAALQRIFAVRQARPLMLRLLTYWGVLTLGPLLIGASLSMTSYLLRAAPVHGAYIDAYKLLDVIPFVLTAIAFVLLYRVVPNRRIAARDAIIGGLCAALLFEAMKQGFAIYIARFPTYTLIYGAFAAIPIFLLWIYLSWLVVLLGAVLAATLPEWRTGHAGSRMLCDMDIAERLQGLLRLLRALVDAQHAHVVPTSNALAARAVLSLSATESLLEELAGHGWVVRASGDRWVLGSNPHTLTVAQIYDRMLFGRPSDDPIVERVRASARQALNLPLAELTEEQELKLR